MTPEELEVYEASYDAMMKSREHWMQQTKILDRKIDAQSAIIADLTAHLHDAIAILGWSKPEWQRTFEKAKEL